MDFQLWIHKLAALIQEMLSVRVSPVNRKVLAVTYAPRLPSLGNKPLFEAISGWNRPDILMNKYIEDIRSTSYGYAKYTISENVIVSDFIPMAGGQRYTPDLFLAALSDHQPKMEDRADYDAILNQFQVLDKIRSGSIDEVWIMAYPFGGLRESRMGGPGAFFCNGEVLENTSSAGRRFIVMGFNYERGNGEMLENFGHRAENILNQVYARKTGAANLWERFTRIEWDHPGQAEVGTIHHGPNALLSPDRDDHQWAETRTVLSRHRTWYNFPNLSGESEPTSIAAWKAGDITWGHHSWWLHHFPHVPGQTAGVSNNWWKYIIDPDQVSNSKGKNE